MKGFLAMCFSLLCLGMAITGCSSEQVKEAKKVTAVGIGTGLSEYLQNGETPFCETPILVCEDSERAKAYIVQKTCKALKVDCRPSPKGLGLRKGFVARFACRSAVKIVGPALFPSKHLPAELKAAGCKSSCLDNLSQNLAQKACAKL